MEEKTKKESTELPDALKDKRHLGKDDSFCFGCHEGLKCFTNCCSDVNIILTPLDVLQLSRKLKITTKEFIDEHTIIPITKELELPVLILRMKDEEKKRCPFLGENGCEVYDSRPWSCRMYPVGMALPPARAGEEPKPFYFLFEDDFCDGIKEEKKWTVDEWRSNQGVSEREELESGYRKIVSHPWFIGGRKFDPKRLEMFFMANYDLDTFKRFIFDSSFLDRFELEETEIEKLRTDDEALLKFASVWLRYALFGEPTMKVRKPAQ